MSKKVVPVERQPKSRTYELERIFERPTAPAGLARIGPNLLAAGRRKPLSPVLADVLAPAAIPKKLSPLAAEFIKLEELKIKEATGTASRAQGWTQLEDTGSATITLPVGFDDGRVNVRTFKQMAKRPGDTLFRKNGPRWDILDDNAIVDLGDRSSIYKLGIVQFFS
jgi:hypothetical protein